MAAKFEDIEVWRLARDLVRVVYKLTESGGLKKDYGLTNQLQRSAISVMSNIAEGFERKSNREFIQFLYISKGSCGELRSQLYAALDLGYISEEQFNESHALAETITKPIAGFIKYLKK